MEAKQNLGGYSYSKEKSTSPKQSSDLRIRSFNAPLVQINQSRGVPPNALFKKNSDNKSPHGLRGIDYPDPRPLQEDIKISGLKI